MNTANTKQAGKFNGWEQSGCSNTTPQGRKAPTPNKPPTPQPHTPYFYISFVSQKSLEASSPGPPLRPLPGQKERGVEATLQISEMFSEVQRRPPPKSQHQHLPHLGHPDFACSLGKTRKSLCAKQGSATAGFETSIANRKHEHQTRDSFWTFTANHTPTFRHPANPEMPRTRKASHRQDYYRL